MITTQNKNTSTIPKKYSDSFISTVPTILTNRIVIIVFMFSVYLMLKIIVKIVKIIDEPIIKAAKKFSFGFIFFILIKFKLLLF